MMSHQQKITCNRLVLRSKINELKGMIAHIEAREDLGDNLKAAATGGLYETIAELEADWDNGWVGAWG